MFINDAVSKDNFPVTFLASFLIWLLVALVVFLFFTQKNRAVKKDIVFALISGVLAWVLCLIVKDLIPAAPRPYRINGFPPLTITIPKDSAFPSGHSALAFGIAGSVFLKRKKLGMMLFVLAGLVGLGRIAGNVHFFIDVLGGAILGLFASLVIDSLREKLGKRQA